MLTSRGVVRAVMEGRDLGILFQAFKPVLELQPALLIQGPDRFAEIPVAGCRIEVQAWRGVVGKDPGEDWVLIQIIEGAPSQGVQLHITIRTSSRPRELSHTWPAFEMWGHPQLTWGKLVEGGWPKNWWGRGWERGLGTCHLLGQQEQSVGKDGARGAG